MYHFSTPARCIMTSLPSFCAQLHNALNVSALKCRYKPHPQAFSSGALELGLMAGAASFISAAGLFAAALYVLPHLTIVCVGASSYPSLPVLFAEGSHYDVGHQIVSWLS